MKYILPILLVCFNSLSSQVLPYLPLSFVDPIDEWMHIAEDQTITLDSFHDGRNQFWPVVKPIVNNGFLFIVSTINNKDFEGGQVEKIDLLTGNVKWKYIFDLRSLSLRESPIGLRINSLGRIEVIAVRMAENKGTDFPHLRLGTDVTFSIHELDIDSGNLIKHIYPSDEERNYIFSSNINKELNYLIYSDDSKRFHAQRDIRTDTQQYIITELDENLNHTILQRKVPIGLPSEIDDVLYGNMMSTNSYNVTFDAKILHNENYKRTISLKFWDKNWNIRFDLSGDLEKVLEEENFYKINIIDATDDKVLISVSKNQGYNILYLLNVNGELIQRVSIDFVEDGFSFTNVKPLILGDDILLTYTKLSINDQKLNKFEIQKLNKNAKYKITTSFNPENQYFIPVNSTLYDKFLVIQGYQFKDSMSNDFKGLYLQGCLYFNFDLEKIGMISSISDISNVNLITLYPNPTSGTIHINGLETPVSITISNVSGQHVKVCQDIKDEVDISDIPVGMYILDIQGKDFREQHKVVKVE
ncbi:MAG: T9SS type A sorting domain-containing protein [Lewinellaceae bacterium]|nr:T9SS type A sorting domain-containing protein [Lewinellaceae bacterium]